MVTVDDVADVVKDRLAAHAAFGTAVPGGAWFGRGPDEPAGHPYTVFQVEAARRQDTSGDAYVQAFTVRLAAYAPVGATGVNPQSVQTATGDALASTTGNAALQVMALRNASEKVIQGRVLRLDGSFAPTAREARDVFACGRVVELLVQGDKGVT
jgi:hypothetical protein